jgi:Taurine catabolism dioxygenase TauD, TfdA family
MSMSIKTKNAFLLSQCQKQIIADVTQEIAGDKTIGNSEKIYIFHQRIPQEVKDFILKTFPGNARGEIFISIENLPSINHDFILIGFSTIVGNIVHYLGEGNMIMDIKVDKNCIDQNPSYRNSQEMALHTDLTYFQNPPDVLSIICVNAGVSPTRNFYCDINNALLLLEDYEIQELKKEQFIFNTPEHVAKKNNSNINSIQPVLTMKDNKYLIRFRQRICQSLSVEGEKACNSLVTAMLRVSQEFRYEHSSLVFIDNKYSTHGRSRFEPDYFSDNPRHLKRIYVNRK